MAYSNWGAFVVKNSDGMNMTETNADETYVWNKNKWEHRYLTDKEYELKEDKRPFSICGSALLFDNNIALVWNRRSFPAVYTNNNGTWNEVSQRELIIDECNSCTKDDSFYLKYPRGEATLSFNIDNQMFQINNNEVYINSDDIISNFNVKGIVVNKINYKYFDVWNITWLNNIIYHVIIGQSLGRGYEKTNISKFIRKYGEIYDNDFAFFPYEKCKYLLKKAVIKYYRHNEYYWLRKEIKDLLISLIKFKWSHIFWNINKLKYRINKIKYIDVD